MQGEKQYVFVFYLKGPGRDAPAARLLELAGVQPVVEAAVKDLEGGKPATSKWGGLRCMVTVGRRKDYRVLKIYIWQNDFIDLRLANDRDGTTELEKDHALPVALAFRDACDNLRPETAFFVANAAESEEELFNRIYKFPELADPANDLNNSWLPLLYLDGELARRLKVHPSWELRDTLPVREGVLAFRGEGAKRWR